MGSKGGCDEVKSAWEALKVARPHGAEFCLCSVMAKAGRHGASKPRLALLVVGGSDLQYGSRALGVAWLSGSA